MWNYVLYATPLIAIEMLDKVGVTIDIVFCLPLICVSDPKNFKNINFSPWGQENIYIDVAQPV